MKLNLDKFELMYFIEGCARGSHLRLGVFERAIDEFYAKLSRQEREFIFHYSVRDLWEIFNEAYSDGYYKCGREHFNQFLARFQPGNLYHVVSEYQGVEEEYDCYRYDGGYWVDFKRRAADEYLTEITYIGEEDYIEYMKRYGHLQQYEIKGRVVFEYNEQENSTNERQ